MIGWSLWLPIQILHWSRFLAYTLDYKVWIKYQTLQNTIIGWAQLNRQSFKLTAINVLRLILSFPMIQMHRALKMLWQNWEMGMSNLFPEQAPQESGMEG